MQKKLNILFLALHHRVNDPRLRYREIGIIQDKVPESKVVMLTLSRNYKGNLVDFVKRHISSQRYEIEHVGIEHKLLNKLPIIEYPYKLFLKIHLFFYMLNVSKSVNPDVVQASDARELFIAMIISKVCRCNVIYDSHEDYVRQILDFETGILKYLLALKVMFYEVMFTRFFYAVFCTDEFLVEKYSKKIYGIKRLSILRNYPYIIKEKQRVYEKKDILKLVYIGGVNKYRGVIECAEYVKLFNSEHIDKKLEFDVYSPKTQITDDLKQRGLINHTEWIDYQDLMNLLYCYDIGICLWLPIPKFYRNLPLKNFDYMASGLPIITSNFGNLKKYLIESEAGVCINPTSYEDFRVNILEMFDPAVRKIYSLNGLRWVKEYGSFEKEAKEYVAIFKELAMS